MVSNNNKRIAVVIIIIDLIVNTRLTIFSS